jgi:hypothetical protein
MCLAIQKPIARTIPSSNPSVACSSVTTPSTVCLRAPVAERIGFGARAHPWRVNEGDALRNQTPHTGIVGCGHRIARSVNAQTRIAFEAFLIL